MNKPNLNLKPKTTDLSQSQGMRAKYGWSESRSHTFPEEKRRLGDYFSIHDFLVPFGLNPEELRKTDARIIVSPGTTPHSTVKYCLIWMASEWNERGPFNVIWYTPGSLTATELRDFKLENPDKQSAAEVFLFPGRVDTDLESVKGDDPVEYVRQQLNQTRFSYSFLGVHGLEMSTGQTYFFFDDEIPLQKECAKLYATQKCLFVDSSKIHNIEGSPGYTIKDLLKTSQAVTIYVNTTNRNEFVFSQYESMIAEYFGEEAVEINLGEDTREIWEECLHSEDKILRLCVVSNSGEAEIDKAFTGSLKG